MEHVLWTVRKGHHTTEARTWMEATGPVLGMFVDGVKAWHQRFVAGDGVRLGEMAEARRRELEERDWIDDAAGGPHFASWNQLGGWLRQVEALRKVA